VPDLSLPEKCFALGNGIIGVRIYRNSDGKIQVWKALSNSGECWTKGVCCWL
jgi:hypothetical protein